MPFRLPWAKTPAPIPQIEPPRGRRRDSNWDGQIGGYIGSSGGGFANPLTGLGTFGRDKVMSAGMGVPIRIPDPELSALFNGSALARRIVTKKPDEMFRRGYTLQIPDPEGEDKDESNAEESEALTEYAGKLRCDELVKKAFIFGRLFGGAVLIIGADDGQDVSKPLNEDNIRSVRYLNMVDRRFLFARDYYGNPFEPNFGEVATYQVTNAFGDQTNTVVHESRVLRFEGAETEILLRRQLAGWTYSILQAPYDVLRMFDQSYLAIANLMVDMSQAVFKMDGMIEQLTTGHQRDVQERMRQVDMMRSSGRAILLDAETEEFTRTPTPVTGVADLLDRFMLYMAMAAEMPVAILFGRSVAGLNATGDADFRAFYDTIASEQKSVLEPKLRRLYNLFCLAKDGPTGGKLPETGLDFVWAKLQESTDKELADVHYTQAQADALYVTNQILLPEEVALSRFRGGQLNLETDIDVDMRKKALAAETDYTLQEKQQRAEFGPPSPDMPGGEPANSQVPAVGAPHSPNETDKTRRQGANTDPNSGRDA